MKLSIYNSEESTFIAQDIHPSKYFDNVIPITGDIIDIISPDNKNKASIYIVKKRCITSRRASTHTTLYVDKLEDYDIE